MCGTDFYGDMAVRRTGRSLRSLSTRFMGSKLVILSPRHLESIQENYSTKQKSEKNLGDFSND